MLSATHFYLPPRQQRIAVVLQEFPDAFGLTVAEVVAMGRTPHKGLFDGVGALLGGMMEVSEGSFQLAVTGASMVNGELVAVPVRFTGAHAQGSMDMSGIDLLTIRDGKIIEVHLFSEDGQAEDIFWG